MNYQAKPIFTTNVMIPTTYFNHAMIKLQELDPASYRFQLVHDTIWTNKVPRAGTCGYYTYINPEFYVDCCQNVRQRCFVHAHETKHIWLRHPQRTKFYLLRGYFAEGVPFIADMFNDAADIVINADNIAMGMEPLDDIVLDSRFGRNDSVDVVYMTLIKEYLEQQQQQQPEAGDQGEPQDGDSDDTSEEQQSAGSGESEDEGSEGNEFSGEPGDPGDPDDLGSVDYEGDESEADGESGSESGDESEGEGSGEAGESDEADGESGGSGEGEGEGDPQPTPSSGFDSHFLPNYEGTPEEIAEAMEEDEKRIERNVDDAIDSVNDSDNIGGNMMGGMATAGYRYTDPMNPNGVDWMERLANVMTRPGQGGDVYWGKINRRKLMTAGIVCPTRKGAISRLAITNDISSSVNTTQWRKFLTNIAHLADLLRPTDGTVIMWTNTDVVKVDQCMSGAELLALEGRRGGGNRLRAGSEYLHANGINVDLHLIFTDGYTPLEDYERWAMDGAIVVLDRPPDREVMGYLNKSKCEYIAMD